MKKRERERDITLVSEQHTKNRLKVNTGLSTVQSTVVCRNGVNGVPPLDEEVNPTVRGEGGEKGKWGGGTGGMHNIQ